MKEERELLYISIIIVYLLLITLIVTTEKYIHCKIKLCIREKEYGIIREKCCYFQEYIRDLYYKDADQRYFKSLYHIPHKKYNGVDWNQSIYSHPNNMTILADKTLKDEYISKEDFLVLLCSAASFTEKGVILVLEDPYKKIVCKPLPLCSDDASCLTGKYLGVKISMIQENVCIIHQLYDTLTFQTAKSLYTLDIEEIYIEELA